MIGCTGEFSSNFDLKNMISTNTKDFFMGKMTQIRQISKKIIRNQPRF
jgi:hypothetical protein